MADDTDVNHMRQCQSGASGRYVYLYLQYGFGAMYTNEFEVYGSPTGSCMYLLFFLCATFMVYLKVMDRVILVDHFVNRIVDVMSVLFSPVLSLLYRPRHWCLITCTVKKK